MEMLHAREMIDRATIASFTSMKKDARSKLESKWARASQPPQEKKAISMDELANILKGGTRGG